VICKNCMKDTASIKFTEVVDGKAVQHFLCPECYRVHQEQLPGFTRSVPQPTVYRARQEKADTPADKKVVVRCPACNASLSQILETAIVGCSSCYTAFGREIESMLEALHSGMAHRGKIIKCDDNRAQMNKNIQVKRILLRRMLKEENYEEAARLRDEIIQLEASTLTSATPEGGQ
jgi:protein arginine kinase activator